MSFVGAGVHACWGVARRVTGRDPCPYRYTHIPGIPDLDSRILQLMGLCSGEYVSFGDLRALVATSSLSAVPSHIGGRGCPSPVVVDALTQLLAPFPDRRLACYGIQQGFRIGVSGMSRLRSLSRNHPSCLAHTVVVSAYISGERAAGRILGLLPSSPSIHVSPIGLVPMGHTGDAWRMIVDLSYPRGRSVNDFISPDICSPAYPSLVRRCGECDSGSWTGHGVGKD